MKKPDYIYKAKVLRVYDGDTITVDWDLGKSIIAKKETLRIYGIDTPEKRGPEKIAGKLVAEYSRNLLDQKEVVIQTIKDKKGKFGRYLAKVWIEEMDYAQHLIDEGLAKPYFGKKKEPWSEKELEEIINKLKK